MCGIVGVFSFTEEGKKYLSHTSAATYSLQKRGPDDEGLFYSENVALGHRRLSIIDTSANARQPMTDGTNRYTIVFNGEIFNYKNLKTELENKSFKFSTSSDTEVLLNAYIAWGESCIEKLDGEFAFAVYDKTENKLFIARDRFGIKPIYYYTDSDKFIFSSELKAILKYGIKKEIDAASLSTYLHLNYIPSPHTIYNNVKKILAANYAIINTKGFHFSEYFTIKSEINASVNYNDAATKLKELLTTSVVNRMVADVPLGTFLSGGLDSSIVSAIAAKNNKNLNTFSVGFKNEKYFDETKYANLVAKKINSEHTVFSLSNDDLLENLFFVLDYIDEPFADSSALAVYILSKLTRQKVKVALSGDGADELFGGYNKHRAEMKIRANSISNSLLKSSRNILKTMPKSRNTKIGNKIRQLSKYTSGLDLTPAERYWQWAGFNNEIVFFNTDEEYLKRKSELLKNINADFNSILLTDVKLVLENDMLVKTDRMSMANSLEIRVPFLDKSVVDFASALPADYKLNAKIGKKILRDAFKNELPAEIFTRAKKGFEVPLLKWFRNELKTLIYDELLSEQFIQEQNLFKYSEIKMLLAKLNSANSDDAVAKIWALIVFQYWWKNKFNTNA
jgi:asparagine synthase (glutamine-hydrolysing)